MSIHARSRNAFAGIEELKALPVGREARDRTYGFLILLFRFREQCLNGSFSSSLLFISIDRGFTRSGHFWEIGLAALLVIIRTLCSFTEERDRRVFSFFSFLTNASVRFLPAQRWRISVRGTTGVLAATFSSLPLYIFITRTDQDNSKPPTFRSLKVLHLWNNYKRYLDDGNSL